MRVRRWGVLIGLGLLVLVWATPGWAAGTLPMPPANPADPPPGSLGRIDAATKSQLQRIWAVGRQLGRNPGVFARVGDSITSSGAFLTDCGYGREQLGLYPELAAIIRTYRATVVDRAGGRPHNSFNRESLAARPGWTGADLLGLRWPYQDAPAPILQEYAAINPSVAVIMFGTNDLDQATWEYFAGNLNDAITLSIQNGVIPILSTIPDRRDTPENLARTPSYNTIIRETAARYNVPLVDLSLALSSLPNYGLEPDNVHPNYYVGRTSNTFTATGLRYGYNVRNLLTLQMLAKVRAIVVNNAPPDP